MSDKGYIPRYTLTDRTVNLVAEITHLAVKLLASAMGI